jgi:hypothetical protein
MVIRPFVSLPPNLAIHRAPRAAAGARETFGSGSYGDRAAIEHAKADGLCDVSWSHTGRSVEIRDRACDAQHLAVGARRQGEALGCRSEHPCPRRAWHGHTLDIARLQGSIHRGGNLTPVGSIALNVTGPFDALSNRLTVFATSGGLKVLYGNRRQ